MRNTFKEGTAAVRSMCIKFSYELCRHIPELNQELQSLLLDIMEANLLPPSINAARNNVLKAMQIGKSLQTLI